MTSDDAPFNHFGQIFYLTGQGAFDAAVTLAEQDYHDCMAFFGKMHPRTASAVNSLGCVYQLKGDLRNAMVFYEKSHAITTGMEDSHEQRKSMILELHNMSECLCVMKDGTRATFMLNQAQDLAAKTPNVDPGLLGSLVGLSGWAAALNGDLENAERLLLEGLTIIHALGSTSQEQELLEILITVYERRGDHVTADQLLKKVSV